LQKKFFTFWEHFQFMLSVIDASGSKMFNVNSEYLFIYK